MLSHGTFVLTSQRTARDWSSDFSGTWNASISYTTDFRHSPTQNKLPALHPDNTVYFCCAIFNRQVWVGRSNLYTTEQKSVVELILCPSHRTLFQMVHSKRKTSQQDIPSCFRKSKCVLKTCCEQVPKN